MLVFVYGSLKTGGYNDGYLKNAQFVDEGVYKINAEMYDMGSFPALVETNEPHLIYGEIYKINDDILKNLDYLEGHPNFYYRKRIDIGSYKNVYTYFIPPTDIDGIAKIKNGCWKGA